MEDALALDHLGIAVASLEEAARGFGALGLVTRHRETVETDGVEVAFLPFSGGRLELLEPVREDSPVARFLDKRGQGLHHVAFRVADIDQALADLRAAGARLIDQEPRAGAEGTRVAFVHPSAMGGVLVELVERADR